MSSGRQRATDTHLVGALGTESTELPPTPRFIQPRGSWELGLSGWGPQVPQLLSVSLFQQDSVACGQNLRSVAGNRGDGNHGDCRVLRPGPVLFLTCCPEQSFYRRKSVAQSKWWNENPNQVCRVQSPRPDPVGVTGRTVPTLSPARARGQLCFLSTTPGEG